MKSFNSSPVVPTPSLGDYSNNVVTSKWVKDVSTAAVYVSPDGDDSNSGMTAAESVKTIGKALEIVNKIPGTASWPLIYVASGTYNEDVALEYQTVLIEILGDISIKSLKLGRSRLRISGGYTLTISTPDQSSNAIRLYDNSSLFISTITCNISSTANSYTVDLISIGQNSSLISGASVTCSSSASSTNACIGMETSYCCFITGLNISDSFVNGIYINSSRLTMSGNIIINARTNGVYITNRSVCIISGQQLSVQSASRCFYVAVGSVMNISSSSVSCILTGSSGISFIRASGGRSTFFAWGNSGTWSFDGTVSEATAVSVEGACVYLNSYTTSGSVTGKRYVVNYDSSILVLGAGVNKFPGTVAGTISEQFTVKDTGNTNRTISLQYAYYG